MIILYNNIIYPENSTLEPAADIAAAVVEFVIIWHRTAWRPHALLWQGHRHSVNIFGQDLPNAAKHLAHVQPSRHNLTL